MKSQWRFLALFVPLFDLKDRYIRWKDKQKYKRYKKCKGRLKKD